MKDGRKKEAQASLVGRYYNLGTDRADGVYGIKPTTSCLLASKGVLVDMYDLS